MITVKKISYILVTLSMFISCAVKEDDIANSNNTESTEIQSTTNEDGIEIDPKKRDSDRDGLRDELERSLGRNPLIGTFPSISVTDFDFFDLKVVSRGDGGRVMKRIRYKDDDSKLFNLEYTPIRDKMAHNAYLDIINQGTDSELNERDLGVFKISNFNENQRIQINEFLKNVNGPADETFIYIDSKFRIKLDQMKGIKKIENITAEIGFINKEGQFENLSTGEFLLRDEDRFSVEVDSTGKYEQVISTSPAFLHREFLASELLEKVFEDNLDMAIKVKDYKATLLDNHIFKFEEQSKKARSQSVLYAIHTPTKDIMFFSPVKESVLKTLERVLENVRTISGRVVSADGFSNTTTSSETEFDLGSNEQLKEASWSIFPKEYLNVKPNIGKTVMLGYFSNYEAAVSGRRLVSNISTGFYTNIETYCDGLTSCIDEMRSFTGVNQETRSERLNNVRIGENIKITISGKMHIPFVDLKRNKLNYTVEECGCAYYDIYGDCENGGRPSCKDKKRVCNYRDGYIKYKTADLVDYSFDDLLYHISFVTEKKGRIVGYDKDFFKYKPTKRTYTNEKDWIFEIRITEDFLSKYGEVVSIKFPRNKTNDLNYGFVEWEDNAQCARYERNEHIEDLEGVRIPGVRSIDQWLGENRLFKSNENESSYEIKIERVFKK